MTNIIKLEHNNCNFANDNLKLIFLYRLEFQWLPRLGAERATANPWSETTLITKHDTISHDLSALCSLFCIQWCYICKIYNICFFQYIHRCCCLKLLWIALLSNRLVWFRFGERHCFLALHELYGYACEGSNGSFGSIFEFAFSAEHQ